MKIRSYLDVLVINFIALFFFMISFVLTAADNSNLIKDLSKTGMHSTFISILENNPLFLALINNTISSTIYAPTDKAFELLPEDFKEKIKSNNIKYTTKVILTHIFGGNNLEASSESGMVLSLDGSLYYNYDVGDLFVKDIVVKGKYFQSNNFTVVPVECVMFLQQSSKDPRLDKEIQSKFKYTTCCLQTKQEYEEFIKNL
jgi:hypothetical protein